MSHHYKSKYKANATKSPLAMVDKVEPILPSFPEFLLWLACFTEYPKGVLLEANEGLCDEVLLARVRLALEFRRRDAAFIFQAVFEDWDHARLLREMY